MSTMTLAGTPYCHKDKPAARLLQESGLTDGEILALIDDGLQNCEGSYEVGDETTITYWRDGDEVVFKINGALAGSLC